MPASHARQVRENYLHFSRNERWGTCASCPQDSSGNKYPEFCEFTTRYDHQLTVDKLHDWYVRTKASE
jgi:hypothetical protein